MKNNELIRKYLHAELSEEEMDGFLQKLETDTDFAEEVKLHSVMYTHRLKNLKASLSIPEANTVSKTLSKNTQLIRILRNVAAIFILASVSYYAFNSISLNANPNLLDTLYNEPFTSPGLLQGAENEESIWQNAIMLYGSKNYAEAETEILKLDSLDNEQQLYLGLSKMYQTPAKFNEAITIFEIIKENADNLHEDATIWYLAIAYLKINQIEKASPLLKTIVREDHYRQKDAIELLRHFKIPF